MKKCPNGHAVKTDAVFCTECGEGLAEVCPNGHPVVPGARFCHLCAAKIDGTSSKESKGQKPAFTATSTDPGVFRPKQPAHDRQGVFQSKRNRVIFTSLIVLVAVIVVAVVVAVKVASGNGYIIAASAGDFRSVNGQQVLRDSGQSLSFQIGWDDVNDGNSDVQYSCGPTWAPANASDPFQWSKGCNDASNYITGGPSGTWQTRPFPGNPQGSGL
jgi:hypothetical protein